MTEWISVQERLPDKPGLYICFIYRSSSCSGFFASCEVKDVRPVLFKIDQKYYHETDTEIIYKKFMKWEHDNVTHWMPLPEAPK